MAIADMDDYAAKLASPFQVLHVGGKAPLASVLGTPISSWLRDPFPGVAPTTAAVPTKDTAGSIDPLTRTNPSANAYVGGASLRYGTGSSVHGFFVLCDRLSHQGGLSGTVTTANVTTNLPTAALTRYTDGVGVMAGIEIYATIGTATTITCTYTDQAGGTSTSQPVVIGGVTAQNIGRVLPINLAAGDSGVRSIVDSTLLASTGTAGAFGYTLFRPLAFIPFMQNLTTDFDPLLGGCGQLTEIVDDACLFWLFYVTSTATPTTSGTLTLIEA